MRKAILGMVKNVLNMFLMPLCHVDIVDGHTYLWMGIYFVTIGMGKGVLNSSLLHLCHMDIMDGHT